jgi:hypothetical protein
MTQKTSLSFSDWVWNEIIGKVPNKSARAEELIIKGYLSERLQKKDLNSAEEPVANKGLYCSLASSFMGVGVI